MREKFLVAVIDTSSRDPILPPSRFIYNSKNNALLGGHALAVCSIIQKHFIQSQIEVFPIFSNQTYETDPELLLDTLQFILNSDEYKLINLSLGIEYISGEHRKRLQELCSELLKKGIILTAAYSNEGVMTYPACFDSVVGVSVSEKVKMHYEYIWIKNSPINMLGCPHVQRVKWDNPSFVFASGSSFVTAFATAVLGNALYQSEGNIEHAMKLVEKNALDTIEYQPIELPICDIEIKNAVVFPFGKEIHSLVRFASELNFNLKAVYDFKYLRNVSRKTSDIMHRKLETDYTVRNAEELLHAFDGDTLILGHCDNILDQIGMDFFDKLFNNICRENKNIYSFDGKLHNEFLEIKKKWNSSSIMFVPRICEQHIPINQMGKLWRISTPVLSVMGTRSKQGKFTLQNLIKQELTDRGLLIKHLSTEPTGLLWNNVFIYPCGHNHTIKVSMDESIAVVNYLMHCLDLQSPDMILTGGQSGTVPYELTNLAYSTMMQTAFLYGTSPDAVILCVSADDELDYILRTIQFIESAAEAKVIAIAVFPVYAESFLFSKMKFINISETPRLNEIIENIAAVTKIPVFENCETSVSSITDLVVQFFS